MTKQEEDMVVVDDAALVHILPDPVKKMKRKITRMSTMMTTLMKWLP